MTLEDFLKVIDNDDADVCLCSAEFESTSGNILETCTVSELSTKREYKKCKIEFVDINFNDSELVIFIER